MRLQTKITWLALSSSAFNRLKSSARNLCWAHFTFEPAVRNTVRGSTCRVTRESDDDAVKAAPFVQHTFWFIVPKLHVTRSTVHFWSGTRGHAGTCKLMMICNSERQHTRCAGERFASVCPPPGIPLFLAKPRAQAGHWFGRSGAHRAPQASDAPTTWRLLW